MSGSQKYFGEAHVRRVAEKMNEVGRQYEQLFGNLGTQIYTDIVGLKEPAEIMAVCIGHIDVAVSAFRKHFPDPSVIACAKGCCHCCSFPIECPPQVIADIARYLEQHLPAPDLERFRLKLARDIAERKPPLNRGRCPFLDEENACSIYDKRPLACRWFTSPDAKLCELSVEDGRNITQHPILHRIYQAATTALTTAQQQHGLPSGQVPFIPSLLEALENEDN